MSSFLNLKFYSSFIAILCLLGLVACTEEQATGTKQAAIKEAPYQQTPFQLQEGDLLFQDSDCGPFCDAIEKVTHGVNGADFSHVGLVIQGGNSEFVVLEAITKGVVETPIDTFLNRSFDENGKPKVVVGRLKADQQTLVPLAVQQALQYRGKVYDDVFDINNDKYYCSELLYLAFKEANNGTPIFQLRPMTYKDPETQKTFPVWEDYFTALGHPIPENQPGINPGSMSRSIYLDIVHNYGQPTGWKAQLNRKVQ